MNRDITDKLLFNGVKNNNEVAFEILFKSYYSQLCYLVLNIVKDQTICEELVADVFFNLWQKRKDIHIKTSVLGYLHYSSRNHAINYLKKKRTHFSDFEKIENHEAFDLNPVEQLISNEELTFWKNKIHCLPPQRKKMLIMNKLEGLSYAEIATKLSLSEKTVRNQVQLAVRSLKVFFILLLSLLIP